MAAGPLRWAELVPARAQAAMSAEATRRDRFMLQGIDGAGERTDHSIEGIAADPPATAPHADAAPRPPAQDKCAPSRTGRQPERRRSWSGQNEVSRTVGRTGSGSDAIADPRREPCPRSEPFGSTSSFERPSHHRRPDDDPHLTPLLDRAPRQPHGRRTRYEAP